MIVIMALVQGIIWVISVNAPQYGLDDSQKDDLCESLINVVRKLGERKIVVIGGYFTTQKTLRTSMEGMVMEFRTRKGKGFLNFI